MKSTDEEDTEPSWLDTDNDDTHRKEVQPLLFGTGKLALTDPEEPDDEANPFGGSTDQNDEQGEQKKQASKGYGSTDSAPASPNHDSLWTIPTEATSKKEDDLDDNPFATDTGSKQGANSDEEDQATEVSVHEGTGKPRKPKRHYCVRIFFTIQSFALMANMALFVSQIVPLLFIPLADSDWGYLALKLYLCIFAMIFAIVELDHPSIPLFQKASFLKNFVSRGFLYTFFGLVCFEEAYSEKAHKAIQNREEHLMTVFEVSWFALVNLVAAWALFSLGVLYFLMGVCCMQRVRNKYIYGDRQKWIAYREAMDNWVSDNWVNEA